jgi:hypothetical protein
MTTSNPPYLPAVCPECASVFEIEQEKHADSGRVRGLFCSHTQTTAIAYQSKSGLWLWFTVGPLPRDAGLDIANSIAQGFINEEQSSPPTKETLN